MFAIVKSGGKQYKVSQDDVIILEKLEGEVGQTISLKNILLVGDEKDTKVGSPFIKDAEVTATVLEQKKDKKIIIFKKKRRQNYRRKNGHRQHITVLRISSISLSAAKAESANESPKKSATTAGKTAAKKQGVVKSVETKKASKTTAASAKKTTK